ncbi:MAG: hypothetical protein HY899_14900 [Deltaproteobacteria bacterium]|nr:hypothetical protein [Deltaproteobacteria bacterium]
MRRIHAPRRCAGSHGGGVECGRFARGYPHGLSVCMLGRVEFAGNLVVKPNVL